jgi:hypothetical protein
VLNVDSEATMDIGIAKTCCATFESVLYFKALLFHQPKISNLSSLESSQDIKDEHRSIQTFLAKIYKDIFSFYKSL